MCAWKLLCGIGQHVGQVQSAVAEALQRVRPHLDAGNLGLQLSGCGLRLMLPPASRGRRRLAGLICTDSAVQMNHGSVALSAFVQASGWGAAQRGVTHLAPPPSSSWKN